MEITLPSKSKKGKYLIYGLIVLLLVIVFIAVYRYYFQFNNTKVKKYIADEAVKYNDSKGVTTEITAGVKYILDSNNLTNQVLASAKNNGTEKEMELVHSAVMQCKAYNYLPI